MILRTSRPAITPASLVAFRQIQLIFLFIQVIKPQSSLQKGFLNCVFTFREGKIRGHVRPNDHGIRLGTGGIWVQIRAPFGNTNKNSQGTVCL